MIFVEEWREKCREINSFRRRGCYIFNYYPTSAEIPYILTLMEKEELEKLEILLEIFNDRTKEDDFQQDEENGPFYN